MNSIYRAQKIIDFVEDLLGVMLCVMTLCWISSVIAFFFSINIGITLIKITIIILIANFLISLFWFMLIKIENDYIIKYMLSCCANKMRKINMYGGIHVKKGNGYIYALEIYTQDTHRFPHIAFVKEIKEKIEKVCKIKIQFSSEEISYIYE